MTLKIRRTSLLFNKSKWIHSGALLAMLASCGGPLEVTEEFDVEADAEGATRLYNEFVNATFNLANLKVEYESEGHKVIETIVCESETYFVDYDGATSTRWLWKDGSDFYVAAKDSDEETGYYEKSEEGYLRDYRSFKNHFDDFVIDNPTDYQFSHKGAKTTKGDEVVEADATMTFKASAIQAYYLLEAKTDGAFLLEATLTVNEPEYEIADVVKFKFTTKGDFSFPKPDITNWEDFTEAE
ncbi:MAG: hypothetical protein J6A47_07800 [Bacilli bacterium]|nr:hypothetical protein [Bacilli bacterium]MBO6285991.1 hypothetical protein [Bacilli bacterium]